VTAAMTAGSRAVNAEVEMVIPMPLAEASRDRGAAAMGRRGVN